MRYELFIGLRYLRAKRKETFISLITVISILGVMIGVMTLNIVLAVITGFEEDLRDRILGVNPHIVVSPAKGAMSDADALAARVREVPGVVAAEPFVSGQIMLSVQQQVMGAVAQGVVPSGGVIDLQQYLTQGAQRDLAGLHEVSPGSGVVEHPAAIPGLILGKYLARQLGVDLGDPLNVLSPMVTSTAIGMVPRVMRFVVVGLFDSGMIEYDASLVYMNVSEAQALFDMKDRVTGIEVRVADVSEAAEVGRRIQRALGPPYRARDWMQSNHSLFGALELLKTVYFIVLLLIVLVAAFTIVATLIMVVMEKRKDIAVLKSMGATRSGVARIFVLKGLVIGVVGTLLGNAGAYLACTALKRYQFIQLPKGLLSVDTLPVQMYPTYFALVTAASVAVCLLATLYPARQAAHLAPVDVIRYE